MMAREEVRSMLAICSSGTHWMRLRISCWEDRLVVWNCRNRSLRRPLVRCRGCRILSLERGITSHLLLIHDAELTLNRPLNPLVPRSSFHKGIKVINEFVTPYIEQALSLSPEELATKAKSEEGYTFLHALASFTRDRKVLRDQLVAVLLAGRDTTASTLSWTFYELARHPEIVKKLRAEIVSQVGLDRPPTYADLKGMKYLQVSQWQLP